MTENGGRASKGNLMTVLRKILKELMEIKTELKELNGKKEGDNIFEKDMDRFRNQNNAYRKG